jgi:MFS family permease
LIPPEHRVAGYAAYRLAFNAGWAFGPATAGFLSQTSFFWLFLGDAVSSWIFGIVALFALPKTFPKKTVREGEWKEVWTVLKANHRFQQLILSSALIGFIFFQMSTTFGLHVKANGFSDAIYGQLISLNGVLVVCFELWLTQKLTRFDTRRVMAVGYLMVGAGFALNAFAGTIPMLVFTMTLFTLGEMMSMPLGGAWASRQAAPHLRGRIMGIFSMTWSAVLIFSPALGMKLFSMHPSYLWLTCGLVGVLAAIVIVIPVGSAKDAEDMAA